MGDNIKSTTNNQMKAKLRWQCRRGMLELDLFLGQFLEEMFETLTEQEQKTFVQILAYPDQTLYRYLLDPVQCMESSHRKLLEKVHQYSCKPLNST